MIKIANPIYDVVFKYIMEDSKVAKVILSDLIGKKILSLTLNPQEYALKLEGRSLLIYRIDFKAKIKLADGSSQLVLIELQKTKKASDIMRFRKYLGEQYRSDENIYYTKGKKKKALPIISIYFLGDKLEANIESPIIYVERRYLDHATREVIRAKDDFIESLTHDSIIVQLPLIKHKRRNEIEMALSLFDPEEGYEISIDETNYPQRYQVVIRKLLEAIADEEMRKKIEIENEVVEYLERVENELDEVKGKLFEEKLLSIERERQLQQEKQRAEQEKQRAEQEKQRAEQLEQEKVQFIKVMLDKGMSINEIMELFNVDKTFLKKYNLII